MAIAQLLTVTKCIECDGDIELAQDTEVGEILPCPDCGVELEVRSFNPLVFEVAPEVEEDWGE